MIRNVLRAVALLCAMASPALAETACSGHYFGGRAPELANPPAHGRELCQRAFATLYDPARVGPVYAVEHLTAEGLLKADRTARDNGFHADPRLPAGHRAVPEDYAGTGFDKGHMAPAHDMPDPEAEHESFLMTNMTPQNSVLNRGLWAQIEEATRSLVVGVYKGEGWVATGAVYGEAPPTLKGGEAVPEAYWKALYVPGDDGQHAPTIAGAWVARNSPDPRPEFISLDALADRFGVRPFDRLPSLFTGKAMLTDAVRRRTRVGS